MKILLFGKDAETLRIQAEKAGLQIVEENPDVVVSYGGDGTFLQAETTFPYIPKILIRNSRICKLCLDKTPKEIFSRLKDGLFTEESLPKIEIVHNGDVLVAVNDIVVHNKDPRHGMRYRVWIDEREINTEIIGDGVVVSTPIGSSGYYRSITDSVFETGLGLAFNNSTEQSDHIVLKDERTVKIEITRGPVNVYADNQTKSFVVEEGESLEIRKHQHNTKIIHMI